eukprot:UN0625
MGLRLGLHTLRGSISKAAIHARSPILGFDGATVDKLATTGCDWNPNWFAVDETHPAAQAWLDSVYGQYAQWGIDFIKNDCIFSGNMVQSNIELVRKSLAKTGRDFEYSLSPGGSDPNEVAYAHAIADKVSIYRVTSDWHGGDLSYHFDIAHELEDLIGVSGLGTGLSFPDLDMLHPYKNTRTDLDFKLQMTLWSIARSPLIYGGDIRSTSLTADDFALMTNPEVLDVQELSSKNRQVFRSDGVVVWAASGPGESTYIALMNTGESAASVNVSFADLGIGEDSTCQARDLWDHLDKEMILGSVIRSVPGRNGAFLLKLSGCREGTALWL